MKQGFTLLELIFTIVIMGVLTFVGFYVYKPNYTQNDANFVLMEILKSKYSGLNGNIDDINLSCVYKEKIEEEANSSNYNFRSSVVMNGKLCFDGYGRPLVDGVVLSSEYNITIKYANKEINISVYPKTGYAKVSK
jgi:prepilin-type N-terminal cleavage/methylation domain-containing protein